MGSVIYVTQARYGYMVEGSGASRVKKVHNCSCVSHHGSLRASFNEYVRPFWSGPFPKACCLFLRGNAVYTHTHADVYLSMHVQEISVESKGIWIKTQII